MDEIPSRELRNNTRTLLDQVGRGQSLTITVAGRPVAVLSPAERRPRWLSRTEFTRRVVAVAADPDLGGDLALLADESTADLPFH